MNFNILIAIKKVLSKLKAVTSMPSFKRYVVLALLLTIVFVIFTFPFEIIVMDQLKKLEGRNFKSISIKQMNISLLGKSYIENLAVTLMNDSSVSINNLTADISFIKLIRKKLRGDIIANKITYSSEQLKAECSVNLDLDLKMDESWSMPSDGKIKADINNTRITGFDLFGISPQQPIKLSIDSNIANSLFTIKEFNASGKDFNGKITGNVTLAPIFGNSKLNLRISVKTASGEMGLSLSGTAAAPKIGAGPSSDRGNSEAPPFETNPEK